MAESWQTRLLRWRFNFFPAYRRTGARVTYIAHDWREVHIKLPFDWRTCNYVGTIFGGSIYAAVDPVYMVMFIKLLGLEYIVWDKAAAIQFKNPGRSELRATFRVEDSELQAIREELRAKDRIDRVYRVELIDQENNICALVEKTIHFRRKNGGQV